MKIVIPVSNRDIHLAEAQAELLAKQGGLAAHTALLVHPYAMYYKLGPILSHLKNVFSKVETAELPFADVDYDPAAPQPHVVNANQMFKYTVLHLKTVKNTEEWFWFEADCVPLIEGWADAFVRQYRSAVGNGKIYLGKILPGANFQKEGKVWKIIEDPQSQFMVGAGIYPHNLADVSKLWKHAGAVPFDRYMQWETIPLAQNTNSILHNHGTQEYQISKDGKSLVCELASTPSRSSKSLVVPKDTLVIHGCKDTSLLSLASEGSIPFES